MLRMVDFTVFRGYIWRQVQESNLREQVQGGSLHERTRCRRTVLLYGQLSREFGIERTCPCGTKRGFGVQTTRDSRGYETSVPTSLSPPRIPAKWLVAMLYVEKDLAQCVKVAFDKWDSQKAKLNYQYLYVANMRLSPNEFRTAI